MAKPSLCLGLLGMRPPSHQCVDPVLINKKSWYFSENNICKILWQTQARTDRRTDTKSFLSKIWEYINFPQTQQAGEFRDFAVKIFLKS